MLLLFTIVCLISCLAIYLILGSRVVLSLISRWCTPPTEPLDEVVNGVVCQNSEKNPNVDGTTGSQPYPPPLSSWDHNCAITPCCVIHFTSGIRGKEKDNFSADFPSLETHHTAIHIHEGNGIHLTRKSIVSQNALQRASYFIYLEERHVCSTLFFPLSFALASLCSQCSAQA